MSTDVLAAELESEINLMEQELMVKRVLLDESRQKLQEEIAEHKKTKSILTKLSNETKELQMQLDVNIKAAQHLESENGKIRETMVKLQVQANTYQAERQQLLDRCYDAELENNKVKNEIVDLKEQIKVLVKFQDTYKASRTQTETILSEILNQQEALKKEQARLEQTCREGLSFATKVSEEADFQAKFVLEANACQIKMEEQMIQLMAVLKDERRKRECQKTNELQNCKCNYLQEWRTQQKESDERVRQLLQDNNRLTEELNFATAQIDMLLSNRNNNGGELLDDTFEAEHNPIA